MNFITVLVEISVNTSAEFYFSSHTNYFILKSKTITRLFTLDLPFALIQEYNNTELKELCSLILQQEKYQKLFY